MKLAAISDVHGNIWALEAVMEDIGRHRPDIIINLGDSLYGPLEPLETFKLLRSNTIVTISGNEDRLIIDRNLNSPTLDLVLDRLNPDANDWLRSLPRTLTLFGRYFLCHGTPDSDTTYLVEEIRDGHISVRRNADLDELLGSVPQQIVFCGHSHLQWFISTPERRIINPGSVGCPAFEDDYPVYHKVENFSNHARYCMVELIGGDINTIHISVAYDYLKAVKCAIKNNRPDWANWLKYGRV